MKIFIIVIRVAGCLCLGDDNIISKEVCFKETFQSACAQDSVIILKTAFYGLMGIGRCFPEDHTSIGCYNDVTPYFDKACSGKRTCSVNGNENGLIQLNLNCPQYIAGYVEIGYICSRGRFDKHDNFNK